MEEVLDINKSYTDQEIKNLIIDKELKKKIVADFCGVHESTVYRFLGVGRKSPKIINGIKNWQANKKKDQQQLDKDQQQQLDKEQQQQQLYKNELHKQQKDKKEHQKQQKDKKQPKVLIAVINADFSNRHKDINTPITLASHIVNDVLSGRNFPSLFVISEVKTTFFKNLREHLPSHYMVSSHKLTYDTIIISWDLNVWRDITSTTVSFFKYVEVFLEHRVTKEVFHVIGCHLPYKLGKLRQQSLNKISESIAKTKVEERIISHRIVFGDFNAQPSELMSTIAQKSELCLCFHGNDITTKSNTAPDNILYSKSLHLKKKDVKPGLFSHHPIRATLRYNS